jgi:hypothetical protein
MPLYKYNICKYVPHTILIKGEILEDFPSSNYTDILNGKEIKEVENYLKTRFDVELDTFITIQKIICSGCINGLASEEDHMDCQTGCKHCSLFCMICQNIDNTNHF